MQRQKSAVLNLDSQSSSSLVMAVVLPLEEQNCSSLLIVPYQQLKFALSNRGTSNCFVLETILSGKTLFVHQRFLIFFFPQSSKAGIFSNIRSTWIDVLCSFLLFLSLVISFHSLITIFYIKPAQESRLIL